MEKMKEYIIMMLDYLSYDDLKKVYRIVYLKCFKQKKNEGWFILAFVFFIYAKHFFDDILQDFPFLFG